MSKYDTTFFQYFQNLKQQVKLGPVNLGGVAGSGGGAGGPPGGFVGFLPQTRVTYDTTEAALSGFVSGNPYNSSGVLVNASLLDNLNHIRFRLGLLEVGSGGGGGSTVKVSSNDTTANYLENKITAGSNIGITVLNDGGNEQLQISATGSGLSDELSKVSSNDTTANYLENKVVAGSNVTVTVLNDGGNEQLSISAVGSGIDTDEKTKVSTNDTTTDYLENKVVAGTNITITVLNDGGNEQLQIASASSSGTGGTPTFAGAKAYSSSANDIDANVVTAITFASTYYDTHGHFDGGANTKLTSKISGYYRVTSNVRWQATAQGARRLSIRANGSTYFASTLVTSQSSLSNIRQNVSGTFYLASGEYVEAIVFHQDTITGTITVDAEAQISPILSLELIGI